MAFLKESETYASAEVLFYEPLFKHTTLGIGGYAQYYSEPETIESLIRLIETANSYKVKTFILGNGSKVLFSDNGYNGIVISTKKLNTITVKGENISALSGAKLKDVIETAKRARLGGLEALVGIPASIGGAVKMNAGAYKESISSRIQSVLVYENNKTFVLDKNQCDFSYRNSRFFENGGIVLEAVFSLYKDEKVYEKCQYYTLKRQCAQPYGKSCGSVFKNSSGVQAGFLIEKAGLKGYRIGGAMVSEKHANFIINTDKATAEDYLNIIKTIKEKVFDLFKVELFEEVIYIGE